MAETSNCQICCLNKSKYSCPRCNVAYCSVSCYQSANHLQCSETFYEQWVLEELKNCQSNPDAKKKMMEVLKQNLETNSEDSLDSDDEEAIPDLAGRMIGVNLDDESAVWEKLTSEEKGEFWKLVATGNILKVLPDREPWWKTKKRKTLIQECDENFDWKMKCPKLPADIPKLLTLTKKKPSPDIAFMLLNVLLAYIFTVRWFKGTHKDMPVEAISTCIGLSATLRSNEVFSNHIEAFTAFEKDLFECQWITDVCNENTLVEDLVDIIKGSDGDDTSFCVKAAISDLNLLSSQALLLLREDKTNHLKRKCSKGSTAVAYTDDLNILASGQEDGSILLFENDGSSRIMLDYETKLHKEPCTDLKIKSSPKGNYNRTLLAGYLSGHIKLWDTRIGKVLFTLKENRQLYGLRYHPRSHKFISVGNDFKVNMYDEETMVTERVLASSGIKGCKKGHSDSVCSAAFHPYNPFELISGGVDGTVQFWDIRAPFAIRRIEGVTMYGDALDLSEDGKVVLCGLSTSWESPLHVYDYATCSLLKTFSKPGSFVYCCKFLSPAFVGVGGFYHNSFKIVNMITPRQVYGHLNGLPGCVMNFALCRKVPRFRTYPNNLPVLALSSGDRIFEVKIDYPDECYVPTDFYYEDQESKISL